MEIRKMQYRLKDYQQVYLISENKFKPISESVDMKTVMKDIVDMTARDIKTRNIELTINVASNVPASISSDLCKVKQVLMNMLMQGINNQFRGFIKIEVEYKEIGEYKSPFVIVEIETSKFDLKSKEITRLSKISQETHFSRILEAKVDINYKVAKLLTNALDWQVNFNAYKSGKQSLMIPVRKDPTAKTEMVIEHVPIEKVVEDLADIAPTPSKSAEITYPGIEIAAIVPTRPSETYPLRKMEAHSEVLLVSYSDIK
jgi:hypothetical protein